MHLCKNQTQRKTANKQIETSQRYQSKYHANTKSAPKSAIRQQIDCELKNRTISKQMLNARATPTSRCVNLRYNSSERAASLSRKMQKSNGHFSFMHQA